MSQLIDTEEQVQSLDAGQWVFDADGREWCLFETHVMVHQWMWKAMKSHTYLALDGIPYPLVLADLDDTIECPHRKVQECGQCTRCGLRVGDPEQWRSMTFGAIGINISEPSDSEPSS